MKAESQAPSAKQRSELRDKALLVEVRVANEKKSVGLAYVLWFFLGTMGIHNFYLGRTLVGVVQIACFVLGPLGVILAFLGVAFVAMESAGAESESVGWRSAGLSIIFGSTAALIAVAVLAVTLLFDLFVIPSAVKRHSDAMRRKYSPKRRAS